MITFFKKLKYNFDIYFQFRTNTNKIESSFFYFRIFSTIEGIEIFLTLLPVMHTPLAYIRAAIKE